MGGISAIEQRRAEATKRSQGMSGKEAGRIMGRISTNEQWRAEATKRSQGRSGKEAGGIKRQRAGEGRSNGKKLGSNKKKHTIRHTAVLEWGIEDSGPVII